MMSAVNADLASYQRISKVVVIKEEWTVDNGVMTPSLKIKRNVIDKRYATEFENWSAMQQEIIFH